MEQAVLDIMNLIPFGALATTNRDGTPYVVPLHFAADETRFYWFSMPSAVHSQNIAENPAVSFTVWTPDRMPNLRGVCINTQAQRVVDECDLERGRTVFTMKFPEIPEAFAGYDMYTAPMGRIDFDKTSDAKWYLRARDLL